MFFNISYKQCMLKLKIIRFFSTKKINKKGLDFQHFLVIHVKNIKMFWSWKSHLIFMPNFCVNPVSVTCFDKLSVSDPLGAKEPQEISYVHVLNKVLPDEIRVIAWAPVLPLFDARFSCLYRQYKYYFPASDMDVEMMNQAAQKFIGEHDFRNFCKMDIANGVVNFQRSIRQISVQRLQSHASNTEYELCEVTICGSAFLWHQVRCLVAVLFLIGHHLEAPEVIDWMLDITQCPRRPQYNMASELPLVLFDCGFENVKWIYESGCVQSTIKLLQKHWTTHAVRSAIAKALISILSESPISQEKHDGIEVSFSKLNPMPANQAKSLVQGILTEKSYTKLKKRKTCDSLEEKLRAVNAKKQRTGKPLITMDDSFDSIEIRDVPSDLSHLRQDFYI